MHRRTLLSSGLLAVASLVLTSGSDPKPDYTKAFSLTLAYDPENGGSFLVVLKNISKDEFELALATKEVEGEFLVEQEGSKWVSLTNKEYSRKAMTGRWSSGPARLKSGEEVKWTEPLDGLKPFGQPTVTAKDLSGKTVQLNLERIAVIPGVGKSSIPFKLKSNVIKIP